MAYLWRGLALQADLGGWRGFLAGYCPTYAPTNSRADLRDAKSPANRRSGRRENATSIFLELVLGPPQEFFYKLED